MSAAGVDERRSSVNTGLTVSGEICYAAGVTAENPLQKDMFSGEWKDTRTRTQKQHDHQRVLPQQEAMFSQRELAQYVNPNPKMPFYPYEKLELAIQDVRTAEEVERDLQKVAEAQTYPLFLEQPEQYEDAPLAQPPLEPDDWEANADDIEDLSLQNLNGEPSKIALYLELVQLSEEQAETLWIMPTYEGLYLTQIAATALHAQTVGLTTEEIQTAIRIGTHRGNARKNSYLSAKP